MLQPGTYLQIPSGLQERPCEQGLSTINCPAPKGTMNLLIHLRNDYKSWSVLKKKKLSLKRILKKYKVIDLNEIHWLSFFQVKNHLMTN